MDSQMAQAFRSIPYGVYILTTRQEGQVFGMVVSWVSQVSYSPPLLMVALRQNRKAIPAIKETALFSLSLLQAGQESYIPRIKTATDPQTFPFIDAGTGSAPFVREALASFSCRLFTTMETGDHVLMIGEVLSASVSPGGKALSTPDYGKTYIGKS